MCRIEENILGYIGENDHCMIHFDKNEMKNKKPIADKDKQDSCAQGCCSQKC